MKANGPSRRRSSSDPVSLEVLGTREGIRTPVSDLMHGLHGSFSLGGRTGRPIVGWMGVGMTFLGVTGLMLWWPRKGAWKNSLGIKKNARGAVWHRQLHQTVGVRVGRLHRRQLHGRRDFVSANEYGGLSGTVRW